MHTSILFRYWGKSSQPENVPDIFWHPLVYHCLDVAAVGYEYLVHAPALADFFRQSLGQAEDETLFCWVAFWLALHDLGKFSEAFQGQKPDLFRQLRGREVTRAYTTRHDTLGWLYWQEVLSEQIIDQEWFGGNDEELMHGFSWWARAVTGHHGQPPVADGCWKSHCNQKDDKAAISEFVDVLKLLFLTGPLKGGMSMLTEPDLERFAEDSRSLSWWIAGLTVLADWLGSNNAYFPYCTDFCPLSEYWERARKQASVALEKSGVLPGSSPAALGFDALFPGIVQPSPLQAWAARVSLSSEPQIHLLEDVTGAGKTEAAVMLAHRLMAAGLAEGFFIALPTMATANAMYGRIAGVYHLLFEDLASLTLVHGQQRLVERFRKSVIEPGTCEADTAQTDETATARCTAWLADRNKSALLASAGVGTIDQVLLSVLTSKHQSLRLLGLFRKVLIVDEVHACDPYMQAVLENLLEFHALSGGSAILLSATLPVTMKQGLLNAFARGRGHTVISALQQMAYPLVTAWPGTVEATPVETAIATRPDVCRTLQTRYVADETVVIDEILAVLARGGCACWMRNTVRDAVDAYQKLATRLLPGKVILFHARFTYLDRLQTEQQILECFGKDSIPADRTGKLVIATQVAEQSLDADWDFVVSDLAPVDRLIQRAGRLCRHPRDISGQLLNDPAGHDQRGTPCLWVYGPCWTETPEANWFKDAFPYAAGVYPHHGQLWRTAQLLQAGVVEMPQDARSLIESVFSPDAEFPERLQRITTTMEGQRYGDISIAQQHCIKQAVGYVQRGGWWDEAKSPSRLGEATTTVILACWKREQLVPWAGEVAHAWAYSSLRVAQRKIAAMAPATTVVQQAMITQTLASLPDRGKWSVLLLLEWKGGIWQGRAMTAPSDKQTAVEKVWQYSEQFGLQELEADDGAE